MSASSSITRTEIFPLRMQQSTVPGTRAVLVVLGRVGPRARRATARRCATIGSHSDDSDRWWPLFDRRTSAAISLPTYPHMSPRSPNFGLLPWSPPSGRPASGGCGLVSLRNPSWRRDGATSALCGCRLVAQRETSPGCATWGVLPAGRRSLRVAPTRSPGMGRLPPPSRVGGAGDRRSRTVTKSRDAGDRVSLRMPPWLKDHI